MIKGEYEVTKPQAALDWIEDQWKNDCAVYVTTYAKQWNWTPENARRWKDLGRDPFKVGNDGHLYMAQGRKYVCILLGSVSLRSVSMND